MFASDEKFYADLQYAEIGEALVWQMLNECEITDYVEDVRKDVRYQALDIDFVLHKTDGNIMKIEVKTDRLGHRTGNFVYETKSNSNEGCLSRSQADVVFYYLSETQTLYLVYLGSLRQYLSQVYYREIPMGDGARGYLVPFDVLLRKRIAYIVTHP